MNVVPETSVYPTVSAPACVPQHYEIPPESLSAPMPPHPLSSYGTCVGPLAIQGQSAVEGVSQGQEYDLGLEQFENNIPGFISYFLNANSTQGAEQRAQSQRGMRGDNKTRGRPKGVRQASVRGDCAAGWEGWNIRKTNQHMHRFGRAAQSVWIGQGGGRVGRTLDTRQVLKHQGRLNRRQGRGAIYREEGERGRSSSRARSRKRQAERVVEPVCQDKAPSVRRTRGRPRKRPLPLPNAAHSEISASVQKATNPSASFLMHTAPLPASNPTDLAQPMDWLIDDVIAQLPFMPPITSDIQNNQDGLMSTATLDSHPQTQTTVKLTDIDVAQPQPEGELTDILDSFLRTFDQHIGACDGMPDGSRSSVTDADQQIPTSNTLTRNDSCYPSRTSFTNTTTPQGPTSTLLKDRPQVSVCRPRKPPFKKLKGCKSVKSETCRMTRSQSRKRELENPQDMRWRDELPAKRRRRKKQEIKKGEISPQNEKKTQLHSETSRKIDSNCNVASALRKVMTLPSARRVKCCAPSTKNKPDGSRSSDLCGHEESWLVKKQACHTKRDGLSKMDQSMASVSSQSDQLVTNTFTGSHPETALSAFELMKNLLENQRNREEEQNKHDHRRWTAKRWREKGKFKLRRGAKKTRPCDQTTSPQNALVKGEEERPIKNNYNKPADTDDDPCSISLSPSTLSESLDSSRAMVHSIEDVTLTNITTMPCVSPTMDPAIPLEAGHIQSSADISEEDVDVVEISSSLSETTAVFPIIADIVPSTEEEDEEEAEIDVLDSD
nr:uncharacterized protein LOC129422125 isoform X1 [Misgurnus anguillicaudatus]